MTKRKIVIALGGNALEREGSEGTAAGQLAVVEEAVKHIADIIEAGNEVIITHGNGPQVGRIILQNAAAAEITPALPFDVCGAMSQGYIGYHIQSAMKNELARRGITKNVATVLTQVLVDKNDQAFANPAKPIGPFYKEEDAKKTMEETGFVFKEDSGRGWRRVVPSPMPIDIIELETVKTLVDAGTVVITAGGGGIPVIRDAEGRLCGVEAVIDKDSSSSCLAAKLGADDLFILTAVPKIALNYNKPDEKWLDVIDLTEAQQYIEEKHFAPGSMLPKVKAAMSFVENSTGRRAIITSLECAKEAVQGKNGTVIVNKR